MAAAKWIAARNFLALFVLAGCNVADHLPALNLVEIANLTVNFPPLEQRKSIPRKISRNICRRLFLAQCRRKLAAHQVGRCLGYTGRGADAFGKAAGDPKLTFTSTGQSV